MVVSIGDEKLCCFVGAAYADLCPERLEDPWSSAVDFGNVPEIKELWLLVEASGLIASGY
jgi:hypothetical protein